MFHWHRWQMEKIFNQKNLYDFFWTPLGSRVGIYNFFFKFILKGQCHEIFCFWFFLWISFPPAPEYPISTVSNTPVANCHRYQQRRLQICRRCRWHRWQIMRTVSGCRHFKVNLKAKIYKYGNSNTQRCPNKMIKIFLLEDFFHLPPVLLTPVVHLEPRISPRIFEKIRKGRTGILICLGETDSWKKPEVENLVTLSLKVVSSLVIVPIVCHRCHLHRCQICRWCR